MPIVPIFLGSVFVLVVAFMVSGQIAVIAAGDERARGWGWLGPVGWIIAAVVGVRLRMERDAEARNAPRQASE